MLSTARAVISIGLAFLSPSRSWRRAGPSDPQIIAAAATAKINVGTRKLAGHMVATLRVGDDGRVREVAGHREHRRERVRIAARQGAAERAFPAGHRRGRQAGRRQHRNESRVAALDGRGAQAGRREGRSAAHRQGKGAHPQDEVLRLRLGVGAASATRPTTPPPPNSCRASPRPCMPPCAPRPANTSTRRSGRLPRRRSRNPPTAASDNPQAPFWEGVFKSVMDEAVPK